MAAIAIMRMSSAPLHFLSNAAASERDIVLVEQSKPRRQYIKKSPRWEKPAIPRKCARCATLETPQWRKVNGQVLCADVDSFSSEPRPSRTKKSEVALL